MSLSAETTNDLCQRLETAEGHLRAVRRMAEDDRSCEQILLQLTAVRAALDKAAGLVLREHLDQCLRNAIASGNRDAALAELESVVRFLRT